jgi:AmmeMemoRadiSam system protein A
VFVTLRTRDGSLRGCVGSTRPVTPTVAEETARSATLAATRDPRFPEVSAAELGSLAIEVSVLLPPEPVLGLADLAPDRYGVIVREEAGSRQGLLLPGIDGVLDAATQVAIARQKAGLAEDEPVLLSRFEVLKFQEAPAKPGSGPSPLVR